MDQNNKNTNLSDSDLICELLLDEKLITEEKLEQAKSGHMNPNEPFEFTLTEMGFTTIEDIGKVLEKYHKVKFVDVLNLENYHLLDIFPEKLLRKYGVVPVDVIEDKMILAMRNPKDINVIDDIQLLTGYKIEARLMLQSSFQKLIDRRFPVDDVEQIVSELDIPDTMDESKIAAGLKSQLEVSAPIIKLINNIIKSAVKMRASDIHVECQEMSVIFRCRVDGLLRTIQIVPKELQPHIISRLKVMCDMDIVQTRLPQDGQMQINVLNRSVNFRASFLPSKYGEKVVLRVLDKNSFVVNLSGIGMPNEIETKIEQILEEPDGMFVVTGPTGSGKTSTLYSMINYLKSPYKNILTLEDPVEFELLSGRPKEGGITQVNINSSVGLDFAQSLRAALRQDPDIIFVGEIRDEETATIAMRASLTGHLVLSTLHTLSSSETVTRLRDMGIEPYLIASCLKGALAQRLVRVLCPKCKSQYSPPPGVLKRLNLTEEQTKDTQLFRPKGCDYCGNTGYYGRIGVFELLIMSDEIKELLLEGATVTKIRESAIKAGTKTLWHDAMMAVIQGKTTVAEIMRVL
ncbi:GspE/PulE family protein [bacterium]